MSVAAAGRYFQPGSAVCVDATVSADGDLLSVRGHDGALLIEAPLGAVRASARLAALTRKLNFPGGGVFETADNDAVDVLMRHDGFLHRLEKSWRAVAASVLLAGAAAAWFAVFGVPLTAAFLARHTPASAAHFMTTQALATLDGRPLRPSRLDGPRQQELQLAFNAVAARQRTGATYRLLLRDAPLIGPNAFAFPDGTVVLTDQLARMTGNRAEIEGVFAHEMAHVNRAHVLQSVYQAAMVPAAVAFMSGDASQASHFAAILPGVLLQSSYSRTFEQQADDDAAHTMRLLGENPADLADLLERMDKRVCGQKGCGDSWLGSHPATAARAARLRQE